MSSPDTESIVRPLVAGGASYDVEFKSTWSDGSEGKQRRDLKEVARDIGEALVAFANSEGGDLLVGVEDTGSITGIPWEGDALGYLEQAVRHQVREIDLGARVHNVIIDGQRVSPGGAGVDPVTRSIRPLRLRWAALSTTAWSRQTGSRPLLR